VAEEDEEFERAFKSMVQESVESMKAVGAAKVTEPYFHSF